MARNRRSSTGTMQADNAHSRDTPPQRPVRCLSRDGSIISVEEEPFFVHDLLSPQNTLQGKLLRICATGSGATSNKDEQGRSACTVKTIAQEDSPSWNDDSDVSEITSVATGTTSTHDWFIPCSDMNTWLEEEEISETSNERKDFEEQDQDKLLRAALDKAATKAREQPNPVTPSKEVDLVHGDPILIDRYKRVERVWEYMNAHRVDGVRASCTEDFRAFVLGPDREVTMTLTLDEINAVGIFESFPNFKFMYRSIRESMEQPGVIVVHDFVATGTHDGAPFAFGPFPAIPPTGQLVVLDASESHYHFCPETNLIQKEEIIALGELTGPPGVYIQLGGTLPPPPPPPPT